MTLSDEQIQELLHVGNPSAEECRLIRIGWDAALARMRTQGVPEGWLRAIDEALVVTHLGVANGSDTYEQAKAKLDNLIGFNVDIAIDPAVNGGYRLVPIELTHEKEPTMQDALMKFDPATGEERPYPSHATQWRNWHGIAAWLFDPWTGRRRNAYDVGSDVHGLLIAPAGTLGMDMGGGCAEKNNVAGAQPTPEAKP